MATGRRQGSAEVGLEICPHTCGCNITERAANKSRRKPGWFRWAPLGLKAGGHLSGHIGNVEVHPNCSNSGCQGFSKRGRPLTEAEYSAWVPHLGHWSPLHTHIPPRFHHLIPALPLEGDYNGVLPRHPLPVAPPPMSDNAVASGSGSHAPPPMSDNAEASGSGSHAPPPIQSLENSMGSMSTGPMSDNAEASGSGSHVSNDGKLLFVGSPRVEGITSLEEAKKHSTYDRYFVTKQTPQQIKSAIWTAPSGFAFHEPADEDEPIPEIDSYYIHDMMAWVIAFLNAGWTLQWMKWSIFREIVLLGDFKRILSIKNLRLMAGGCGLAVDYITVHPGLDKGNFDTFWDNLLTLSRHLPMFPHPVDLLDSAAKIKRDNDLMVAATTTTMTPFPRSITLASKKELLAACEIKGLVIKRDFSDSTSCTYLPSNDGLEARRRETIVEKWDETQDLYHGIRSLPPPSWMAQPFMEQLAQKGELRAFVVGGKMAHVIHTWPHGLGAMHQEFVDNLTPLSLLQAGPASHLGPLLNKGGKSTELCNENLTEVQVKDSWAAFTNFVESTVEAVRSVENTRRGDESSSLQVFCRVDVGILEGPDHRFYYYVNELERSLTVGLYRATSANYWMMLNSAVDKIPLYIERSKAGRGT